MRLEIFFVSAILVSSIGAALIGVVAFLLYLRDKLKQICCWCSCWRGKRERRVGRLLRKRSGRKAAEPVSLDNAQLDLEAALEHEAHFGHRQSDTSVVSDYYDEAEEIQKPEAGGGKTYDEHEYASLHRATPEGGELTPFAILMAVPENYRFTLPKITNSFKKKTSTA